MILDFLFAPAYGQAAESAAQNPQSFLTSLLPFMLIFAVFYFLMIRPQKKRMDLEQKYLSALKKGDEVYTKSGLIGVIESLSDRIVTLKLNESNAVRVLRTQVAGPAEQVPKVKEPVVVADKKKK